MIHQSDSSLDLATDYVVHQSVQSTHWWAQLKQSTVRRFSMLTEFLMADVGKEEPQVTWRRNRRGHFHLEIYDPMSQSYQYFGSEQGAKVWLENRYNYPHL